MKNLITLAIASLSILIFSCDNDDNEPDIQLKAKWRLTNVSGGLLGYNHNFTGETITWEFNAENNTVTVVNNNTNDEGFDGPDSGNYTYGFATSEVPEICAETIEVNSQDYGCVTQTATTLKLSNNYADGFILTFEYMPPLTTN